ncbi:MAG: alpha-hydroxy acid oxidase, partial [Pseudomonadota bacterium]
SMCLTVDVPVPGNREMDLVTGFTMPPRFNTKSMFSFATHPRWSLNIALRGHLGMANFAQAQIGDKDGKPAAPANVGHAFDRSVDWDRAAEMVKAWGGPFAIKGVMSVGDAKRAVDIGASAVIVSNHGGRQLDGAPATIDCLGPIVDAVGDRVEVILDGGIRRGVQVLKALALGAKACMIGRPYLYGLAAAGQPGVERVLSILQNEIKRDMTLLGVCKIDDINRDFIRHRLRDI